MIAKYLSEMWTAVAPAVGNHLWQSTVFAGVAGLLTLALRKNHARARYWVWLAASVKFLVPFSLLVGIGSWLGWAHGPARSSDGIYFAMEQVSQPFAQAATPAISSVNSATPATSTSLMHLLPVLLVVVWLCGFMMLLFVWCVRWRRMSGVVRGAAPLLEGREVEALRRLERVGGTRRQIDMLVSDESLEPAIFGIVRPVLIWPAGISGRLGDAHVESILAHEMGHVRRRDNLSAAMHMVVKAIFWFHPAIWWLGSRLAEERELACDEEVLQLGSGREVYAESILKVCEFCVGSPLACVSGVTGADLKKRIVRIMSEGAARKMDFGRKLLLSAAMVVAIAAPVVAGLMNSPQEQGLDNVPTYHFEVSTIKPNNSRIIKANPGFTMDGFRGDFFTLRALMVQAYGMLPYQMLGGPAWMGTDAYNVEAKMDGPTAEALSKLRPDQLKLARQKMLQSLLEDRFGLKVHRETKDGPVYLMVVAKGGSKLQEAKPLSDNDKYLNPDGTPMPGVAQLTRAGVIVKGYTAARVARLLSAEVKRPVLDKTGLTGTYDFTLEWARELAVMASPDGDASDGAALPMAGSIFTAIQEQLGLKLETGKGPVQYIVIDHVEKPSGN
jgi:bla regulator protein BlaR1